MSDTYKIGSDSYNDIANDEGAIVCDEHATDEQSAGDLWERYNTARECSAGGTHNRFLSLALLWDSMRWRGMA